MPADCIRARHLQSRAVQWRSAPPVGGLALRRPTGSVVFPSAAGVAGRPPLLQRKLTAILLPPCLRVPACVCASTALQATTAWCGRACDARTGCASQ
jgi:hypothetical protein